MSQPATKDDIAYILFCLLSDAADVTGSTGIANVGNGRANRFFRYLASATNERWRLEQAEEPVSEKEISAVAKLEGLAADGCLTGDCPHSSSKECDAHLADEYRKAFGI